jgi:hypothetical protein
MKNPTHYSIRNGEQRAYFRITVRISRTDIVNLVALRFTTMEDYETRVVRVDEDLTPSRLEARLRLDLWEVGRAPLDYPDAVTRARYDAADAWVTEHLPAWDNYTPTEA